MNLNSRHGYFQRRADEAIASQTDAVTLRVRAPPAWEWCAAKESSETGPPVPFVVDADARGIAREIPDDTVATSIPDGRCTFSLAEQRL